MDKEKFISVLSTLLEKPNTTNVEEGLSDDEYSELFKDYSDNIKYYNQTDKCLYRGIEKNDPIFISKPVKRVSNPYSIKSIGNFYTLIMDNDPRWINWPKRSYSFICSNRIESCEDYISSEGSVYRVFPLNNAVIATCNSNDIWETVINRTTERLRFFDFQKFGEMMVSVYQFLNKNPETATYEELMSLNEPIDPEQFKDSLSIYDRLLIQNINAKNEDVMQLLKSPKKYIEMHFDPKKLGFELIQYKELKNYKSSSEFWFSSEALFIRIDAEINEKKTKEFLNSLF